MGLAGRLHLVEVLFGEEAAVGEQRLVHRAQLVDAELGVGDAPAPCACAASPLAAAGSGAAEGHQPQHPLQHVVAQLHLVQQRRGVFAEQPAVQRTHGEAVALRLARRLRRGAGAAQQVLLRVEAVADEAEQLLDAQVQVMPVARFLGGQPRHLQVAQPLQPVAAPVRLGVQRRVVQHGPRLDVEQEQQPVHVPQRFEPERVGERGIGPFVDALLRDFAQMPDRLVADELDALPQRVLQVLGDPEGVPVAVLVQPVQQALPAGGKQALAVEKGRGSLERGLFAAGEDLVEVEPQGPVVRPLPAFEQEGGVGGEEDDPPRRPALREDALS